MKPNGPGPRTPEWLLERIAQGALPPERLALARTNLLAEPDGADRLATLEADTHALLERHRPEDVVAEVKRRAHLAEVHAAHAKRGPARPWLGLGAIAAVVGVLLVINVAPDGSTSLDADPAGNLAALADGSRSKSGGPRLLVHRKGSGAQPQLLSDADTARAGDVLQLSYQAAGRTYGAILSQDGRGALTLHLPEHGSAAIALEPQGTVALPFAYALDDAPSFERFVFVTASAPFDLEPVRDALQAASTKPGARLSLPAGLELHTLELRKSTP